MQSMRLLLLLLLLLNTCPLLLKSCHRILV
jgi:hypothetical protein